MTHPEAPQPDGIDDEDIGIGSTKELKDGDTATEIISKDLIEFGAAFDHLRALMQLHSLWQKGEADEKDFLDMLSGYTVLVAGLPQTEDFAGFRHSVDAIKLLLDIGEGFRFYRFWKQGGALSYVRGIKALKILEDAQRKVALIKVGTVLEQEFESLKNLGKKVESMQRMFRDLTASALKKPE